MFRQWESPAAVFELLRRLSADQPCDITGIAGYEMLAKRGGVQWPFPAGGDDAGAERRLFEDGRFYHAEGRARFIAEAPRPLPESPNPRYPFILLTGRGSAAQWHTQTRTAKSAILRTLYPQELHVELNPQDARHLEIRTGDLVRVASQRGQLLARARITPTMQPGQAFLPMHDQATNRLTDAVFDPYSHQPAYKACAISITRASSVSS
jgi:assimilatory nitrate reductase catalytic subunit